MCTGVRKLGEESLDLERQSVRDQAERTGHPCLLVDEVQRRPEGWSVERGWSCTMIPKGAH